MLKIHNFRAGFATNSSSSHSVLLIPPSSIGTVCETEPTYENSYGWENFCLVSPEQKIRYLAAQLFSCYMDYSDQTDENKEIAIDIATITDMDVPEFLQSYEECLGSGDTNGIPSLDHQSVLWLPKKYDGRFVRSLVEFFKSPSVIVTGGNNNSDPDDSYQNLGVEARFLDRLYYSCTVGDRVLSDLPYV